MKTTRRAAFALVLLSLAILLPGLLSGCSSTPQPTAAQSDRATTPSVNPPAPTAKPAQPGARPTLYIPPTPEPGSTAPSQSPSVTPSLTLVAEPVLPSITPTCTNGLKFLEDLTIPDGSQVSPGQELDKRWKVQNSGTCNWDARYTLRLVSGLSLGAPEIQPLYPARAGTEAILRMLFTAPAEPGSYQSAWKAYDPAGVEFEEAIFIQIVVK